jgi:poly-gamma-glutamate synthesis protein (capsule biosynthesis protein)
MVKRTRTSRLLPVVVAGALTAGLAAETVAQDRFTLALTGDSIITRKLSVYEEPEFLRMVDLLRGADLAFTNVEILFHDWESYPMSSSGGTYMRAQPELVHEFVWAGIDIGSLANNHSGDYGPPAMLLTEKYIREAGIVAAGVGRSLAEAREAKFIETKDGRVALISLASTFPDHSMAGKSRDDIPPRPGLSHLRHIRTYEVTKDQLEGVRATMRDLKMNPPAEGTSLNFLRNRFELADAPGVRTEPHPDDMAEIAMIVSNARRQADYVMVTIHAHEGAPGPDSRMVPAQFLVTFARAMVDAGASAFVGHGPHALRAIEMYKGVPILYSLGDFVFQNETLQRLPYENYHGVGLNESDGLADFNEARYNNDTTGFPTIPEIWEAVIAVPEWSGQQLVELTLHPISLGYGQPRHVRGRPMMAEGPLADKILQDLVRLSEPYGTQFEIKDGVARVVLPAETTDEQQ